MIIDNTSMIVRIGIICTVKYSPLTIYAFILEKFLILNMIKNFPDNNGLRL